MKKYLILISIFVLFILSTFKSCNQNIKIFKRNNNNLEKNVIVSFTTYKIDCKLMQC